MGLSGIIGVGFFDVEHSEVAIVSTSARPVVTVHHAGDARRIIKSTLGLTGRRGLTRSRVLRLPEPPVALAVPLLGEDSIHRSLEMSHCVWIRRSEQAFYHGRTNE
jgi:hypothetical protein